MTAIVDALRAGTWLSRERIRLIAAAVLAAALVGAVYLVATGSGLSDRLGRPLGTDFSSFYAAGTLVLDGTAAAPYDIVAQHAREQEIFGSGTPFFLFAYPPFFLLIAAALALMSYPLALTVWQAASLALYLAAIRSVLVRTGGLARDPLWLLLALAFPAVMINVGHGQNGFLTAGLFSFALATLERRPLLAGVLFGLIAYKPQFGLMIPLVLIATGRWRTVFAAAATIAMLGLATLMVFGTDAWRGFLDSMSANRTLLIEDGDVSWSKMQSAYAALRLWGASMDVAFAIQAVVTLSVAVALVWLWRGRARYPLKAAALLIATLLGTPFCLDYDLMLLAPAIAFLAADGIAHGFAPWQKSLLAALWFMPLVARSVAEATLIPLATPLMLLGLVFILRLAAQPGAPQRAAAEPWPANPLPAPRADAG